MKPSTVDTMKELVYLVAILEAFLLCAYALLAFLDLKNDLTHAGKVALKWCLRIGVPYTAACVGMLLACLHYGVNAAEAWSMMLVIAVVAILPGIVMAMKYGPWECRQA